MLLKRYIEKLSNTEENQISLDYMKANLAHEFRTPFAAINVSLRSLEKIFPVLLESYVKASEAGLVEMTYKKDFLDILNKSIKNSLSEIKFSEFYLNKLLLLIKGKPTINSNSEKINLKTSIEKVVSLIHLEEPSFLDFDSNITFEVEFNENEFESYLHIFIDELVACKNEQQTERIKVYIDDNNMKLSFQILKSKSNSYISQSIKEFTQGKFHHRYGVGFYLLNQLINSKHGELDLRESSNEIRFIIKF